MKSLREAQNLAAEALLVLADCKRAIQEVLPGATVLLYGSLARGAAGPESDWDILVLTPQPISATEEQKLREAVYAIELDQDVVLSLLIYPRGEWDDPPHRAMPLHEQVGREGVRL